MRRAVAAAVLALSAGAAWTLGAQTPAATLVELAGTPRGTVRVRASAPGAATVRAFVDTQAARDAVTLTRDDRGVWSGEISGLAPDIYEAALLVTGPGAAGAALQPVGTVLVPGTPPEIWEPRRGPHGDVRQIWYDSKALKVLRSMWVYTPPGYDTSGVSYPTLYLLHGSGGTEASWVAQGGANVILDNLIADGRAAPMVVVMPFGHTEPSMGPGSMPSFTGRDATAFAAEVTDEILPMIEKRFRVTRKAEARAIAGLSMGGGQARTLGLSRPDLFRWIGTFSGSMPGLRTASNAAVETMLGDVLTDPAETNANLSLWWMAVGEQETAMLAQHRALDEVLRNHRIRHTFITIPGGHTWHVWRRNLRDFVPLLFPDAIRPKRSGASAHEDRQHAPVDLPGRIRQVFERDARR